MPHRALPFASAIRWCRCTTALCIPKEDEPRLIESHSHHALAQLHPSRRAGLPAAAAAAAAAASTPDVPALLHPTHAQLHPQLPLPHPTPDGATSAATPQPPPGRAVPTASAAAAPPSRPQSVAGDADPLSTSGPLPRPSTPSFRSHSTTAFVGTLGVTPHVSTIHHIMSSPALASQAVGGGGAAEGAALGLASRAAQQGAPASLGLGRSEAGALERELSSLTGTQAPGDEEEEQRAKRAEADARSVVVMHDEVDAEDEYLRVSRACRSVVLCAPRRTERALPRLSPRDLGVRRFGVGGGAGAVGDDQAGAQGPPHALLAAALAAGRQPAAAGQGARAPPRQGGRRPPPRPRKSRSNPSANAGPAMLKLWMRA